MENKEKYKAAIVGCGRIASEFDDDPMMVKNYGIATHAGAYADNKDIDLIAAADINEEKLQKFGHRWNVESLYSNYEDMLENEQIDILSICTPNTTHLEIFEKAVDAGVKTIFCEKPIADSLEHADRMVDLSKEKGVRLFVNHRRRWDGLYQEVRKFIKDGGLGDIQQTSCYYNAGIANTGCHLIDVLRMLFGEAITLTGWYKGDSDKLDPDIDGCIRFENGASATLQSLNIEHYLIFEIDIYGTEGRLRIENNGFSLRYWKVLKSDRYDGLNELVEHEPPFKFPPPEMFRNAVKNIVASLKTNVEPSCSGEDGVKALEIINAFHTSVKNENRFINLPLKERAYVIASN